MAGRTAIGRLVRVAALCAVLSVVVVFQPAAQSGLQFDSGVLDQLPTLDQIIHAPTATPGGAIVARLVSAVQAKAVTFALCDEHGNRRVVVPAYSQMVRGRRVWVAIIGLPTELDPGRYQVCATLHLGFAQRYRQSAVVVEPRAFATETIALNPTMSDLRATPDPEKTRQALALQAALAVFNPAARYADGAFTMPVERVRITSGYGDRRRYRYADGSTATAIHVGIDFGGAIGTPVFAPAAGRIVMAEFRIVTGNTVVVEHWPGVFSVLMHLDRIDAMAGEVVSGGRQVGTIGVTGLVTGPHLHWEVRVSRVAVDPLLLADDRFVDTNGLFGVR